MMQPEELFARNLNAIVEQTTQSVQHRDLGLLLEGVWNAVPEYRPGHLLQKVTEDTGQIGFENESEADDCRDNDLTGRL